MAPVLHDKRSGLLMQITNTQLLEAYLATRLDRHQAISSNIANADTPGFKAVDLSFQLSLDEAVGSGAQGGEPSVAVKTNKKVEQNSSREDGNSVIVEMEMAKLAENSAQYLTGVKLLSRQMALLKYAVSGGR